MHLASMLQVNNTLKELEVADCDLVNTHTYCSSRWFLKLQMYYCSTCN